MERVLDASNWWIWVVNGVGTLACLIAFCVIDGKQEIYSLYIPLDILINVAKSAFFWMYYFIEKRRLSENEYIEKRILERRSKTSLDK